MSRPDLSVVHLLLAGAALAAPCGAAALSIGAAQGAVEIGRALQLEIPVALDQRADSECATAELAQGADASGRPVQLQWKELGDRGGILRVASGAPVEEPVVTLALRIGCRQPVTRSLVLLAHPPATAIAPADALPLKRHGPAPSSIREKPEPAAKARPLPRRPVLPPAPRSRLELDPLEPFDPPAQLRLTPVLAGPSAPEGMDRAAAAALWAALQRSPEDAVAAHAQLHKLQAEITSLRALAAENAHAAQRLQSEGQGRSEALQAAHAMAAALATAVLLLLAWAVQAERRRRRSSVARAWFEPGNERRQGEPQPHIPSPPVAPSSIRRDFERDAPTRDPRVEEDWSATGQALAAAELPPALSTPVADTDAAPWYDAPASMIGVDIELHDEAAAGNDARTAGGAQAAARRSRARFAPTQLELEESRKRA